MPENFATRSWWEAADAAVKAAKQLEQQGDYRGANDLLHAFVDPLVAEAQRRLKLQQGRRQNV